MILEKIHIYPIQQGLLLRKSEDLVESANEENVVSLPEMVTRSDIGIHRLAILNRNYVDPIFLADIQLYRSPADPVLGNR